MFLQETLLLLLFFDSGASFWYWANNQNVAELYYYFRTKPFLEDPFAQLDLVRDTSWLDLDALDDFEDELFTIFSESAADDRRVDYIIEGYRRQFKYLASWL